MMKLFGAVLVILGTGWGGFILAEAFRNRCRQLQQFIRGLNILSAEVGYGLTPLEAGFRRVAKSLENQVGWFFLRAAEEIRRTGTADRAWLKAVETCRPLLTLSGPDWEIIAGLSVLLGNVDKTHQLEAIRKVVVQLEDSAREAQESSAKNDRIYRYSGFALGIVVVLLLY